MGRDSFHPRHIASQSPTIAEWMASLPMSKPGAENRQTLVVQSPAEIPSMIVDIKQRQPNHPCIVIQKSGDIGDQLHQIIVDSNSPNGRVADGPGQALYDDAPPHHTHRRPHLRRCKTSL